MAKPKKRGKKVRKKSKASKNFIIALSLVSIIGFLSIMTKSLFGFSFENYIESLWLIILGTALILETSIDERIACEYILNNDADIYINILMPPILNVTFI